MVSSYEQVLEQYGLPKELAGPGEFNVNGVVTYTVPDGRTVRLSDDQAALLMKVATEQLGKTSDDVLDELHAERSP